MRKPYFYYKLFSRHIFENFVVGIPFYSYLKMCTNFFLVSSLHEDQTIRTLLVPHVISFINTIIYAILDDLEKALDQCFIIYF